jgi:hypothetical protein
VENGNPGTGTNRGKGGNELEFCGRRYPGFGALPVRGLPFRFSFFAFR